MSDAGRTYTADPSVSTSGDESLPDLIRQLTHQGSHLAEQQLNLLRAEMREAIGESKAAAGALAGAAVVGIAGLGVTLMGLAYLLGDALEDLGLGTLIVGIAALVLGFVLYTSAKSKLRATSLSPDRTVRTLERTPEAARGNLTSETTS